MCKIQNVLNNTCNEGSNIGQLCPLLFPLRTVTVAATATVMFPLTIIFTITFVAAHGSRYSYGYGYDYYLYAFFLRLHAR